MEGNQKMFQHAIWKVETHGNSVTCIVIYRPPYSSTNKETVTKFLNKFTEWLANILGLFSNMVVLGDFNVHINDENDNKAGIFEDTITALGFNQHVTFPTHWEGNFLDLVFTETCNSIKVKPCRSGPILSNHMAVDIVMAQPSQPIQRKLINTESSRTLTLISSIGTLRYQTQLQVQLMNGRGSGVQTTSSIE